MTVSDLLAWAYGGKLKQAERGSRVYNPVGLVRAQWRKGQPPRADLQRLARGWLLLNDNEHARLLGRLEWAVDFGPYDDHDSPLADEFPEVPLGAASAVYTATSGQLAPPHLMPTREVITTNALPPSDESPPTPSAAPPLPPALWKEALDQLEMQMTKSTFSTWLRGSTADLVDDVLTVYLVNTHAVDWVSNRLDTLIRRTVAEVVGRRLDVHYHARQVVPESIL